jgi:GT2 family glycosyltransferase
MFLVSLAATQQPTGTNLSVQASANVTENLNVAIRGLRDEDRWLWILGDDHVWQGDCLTRMLNIMDENEEIDILVPLVCKRSAPWLLVVFHEDGLYEDGMPRWKHYGWDEIPDDGVFEIGAAGSAGMLIRREVLDTLGDPWFVSTNGAVLNEDVIFCQRAREAGFTVFATADVTMGHLGIFNVRPMQRDGRWGALTEFSTPEEQFKHIFMPPELMQKND